jgi:hypothetical protein
VVHIGLGDLLVFLTGVVADASHPSRRLLTRAVRGGTAHL